MKKIVLTLMLCLSCATCFANEVPVEARMGKQFVATVTNSSFGELFKEMHKLGYIPHKTIYTQGSQGITQTIYITWMKTHIGGL